MLKSLMIALAGLGMSTMAAAATIEEGQDYKVLEEPVKTHVEDSQIARYRGLLVRLPHCYDLEEPLNAWVEELPEDVVFERMPATMGGAWNQHAMAFYAARELGIQEELHSDFFTAIHEEGRQLTEHEAIADFFSGYGVSQDEVLKALDSFGVKSQVNQAHARMRNMQLMGVPALVVDGRYLVTSSLAGSLDNMPKIAEALVDKVRAEQAE